MGINSINAHFGSWLYGVNAPQIEGYVDILLARVISLFDDVDGEQERAAEEVLNWPGWGPDDYERAMETAYEISIDKALQFMELRSVFLATGVSGLFHLFEKQVYKHLNHELSDWMKKDASGRIIQPIQFWKDARIIIERLKYKSATDDTETTELRDAFSAPVITELRLVANSVKHGEGDSYDKLKKMNACVVSEERLENEWSIGPYSILGVNIAITPDDVERYKNALLAYWQLDGLYCGRPEDFVGQ